MSQGSIGVRSSFNLLILSNDDPRGVLSFDPLSTTTRESDGNATLTIRRSGGLAGTIRSAVLAFAKEASSRTCGNQL